MYFPSSPSYRSRIKGIRKAKLTKVPRGEQWITGSLIRTQWSSSTKLVLPRYTPVLGCCRAGLTSHTLLAGG